MTPKFDRSQLPSMPDLSFEQALWLQGVYRVAGIDEAGRGALAGMVSAAAVILPCEATVSSRLEGVRDSKAMTAEQRELWAMRLKENALAWAVGFASNEEIDALGIVPATRLAARRAVELLQPPAQYLLVDFLDLPNCKLPQIPLVKGDARSLSIASASVLAKTARDAALRELETIYPGYGFARHKGYGTAAHYLALERLGPCPVHRKSFTLSRPPEN